MNRKFIFFYNLMILALLYAFIAFLFAFIYIIIENLELGSIIDHYSTMTHQKQQMDQITRSIYFSFITLFAVGYGDLTPFGLCKAIAILQALIGYILPYAIILNYVLFNPSLIKHLKDKLK